MPRANIKDLNIRYKGHPKYNDSRIIEDRTIEFIIQKLEVVLFTNKGEVLSDPDFGANLEHYLWSTSVPIERIQSEIKEQIDNNIPELNLIDYTLELELFEGTVRDILFINFVIKDTEINFVIK